MHESTVVWLVVLANVGLGLGCLLMATAIWSYRRRLKRATRALLIADRAVHRALHQAPEFMAQRQHCTAELRHSYQHLEHQLQRARQLLRLLGVSLGLLQWQIRRRSRLKVR